MNNAIASLFNKYHEDDYFSGAGLVKKGDEILFSQAYGLAHRGFKVPNTVDTLFDTASITKLFTAAAILQGFGIGAGGALPDALAPLLAIIEATPAPLAERLLTELLARLVEPLPKN